jgi:hypothetical protein
MGTTTERVTYTSIVLYTLLFLASQWQLYVHLYNIRNGDIGKLSKIKLLFFVTLSISAFLSLPFWIMCLIRNCPNECTWDGYDYELGWILHILVLAGYALCVGIPTIVWSDIVSNRFDEIYYSIKLRKLDATRIWFIFFFFSYLSLELGTIISALVYMDPNNNTDFFENNLYYKINVGLEPAIICMFTVGCLISGIRLQLYVIRTLLEENIQRKLLIQMNIILTIVTASYVARAFLIFDLFIEMFSISNINFAVWILCTQWLPQIICSFCLLYIMSRASSRSKGTGRDGYSVSVNRRSVQISGSKSGTDTSMSNNLVHKEMISPLLSPNNNYHYRSDGDRMEESDYDDNEQQLTTQRIININRQMNNCNHLINSNDNDSGDDDYTNLSSSLYSHNLNDEEESDYNDDNSRLLYDSVDTIS